MKRRILMILLLASITLISTSIKAEARTKTTRTVIYKCDRNGGTKTIIKKKRKGKKIIIKKRIKRSRKACKRARNCRHRR